MGLVEILILSSGVAMDAMAVSICKAPCIGIHERYKMIVLPLLFGLFQMIMPIIGWFIGEHFLSFMKDLFSQSLSFALGSSPLVLFSLLESFSSGFELFAPHDRLS